MVDNSSNSDLIALTCAACGAKLHIGSDIDRFACSSCGTEFMVRRGGGVVSLQPITEGLSDILVQNKRIAAELALTRLKEEIVADEEQLRHMQESLVAKPALASQLPPDWFYAVTVSLVVLGVISVSGGGSVTGIGVLMLCGAIWPSVYIFRRTQKLKGERNAMLSDQQQRMNAAHARIAGKKVQIDALRRGLA